jgi:hypothetical protein
MYTSPGDHHDGPSASWPLHKHVIDEAKGTMRHAPFAHVPAWQSSGRGLASRLHLAARTCPERVATEPRCPHVCATISAALGLCKFAQGVMHVNSIYTAAFPLR